MKKLLFILSLLVCVNTYAQTNYTTINGRYKWIAGIFDSTFHIPKGTNPSIRTGGWNSAGALFYKTSDSSIYAYTGSQWLKVANAQGFVPYVGATTDLNLGNYGLRTDNVTFKTSSLTGLDSIARLKWDTTYGTLKLGLAGGNVQLQLGQEEVALVHNNTGSTLTDGQVVYVYNSTGELPSVKLASDTAETSSSVTFGVVTESIAQGENGFVTISGMVHGLNTNAYTEGAALWLGTTPGTFTQTKPQAPNHSVLIGYVIKKSGGNGSIFVKIQNGYELDELHNVKITNPLNKSILTYDSINKIWVDTTLNAIGGLTGSGTTNYVSKFTGTNTLGNSYLSDNNTTLLYSGTGFKGIKTQAISGNTSLRLEAYSSSTNADNGVKEIEMDGYYSSYNSYFGYNSSGGEWRMIGHADNSDVNPSYRGRIEHWIPSKDGNYGSFDIIPYYNTSKVLFRVQADGKVGIGNATPDSLLTVSQGTLLQRGVRMSGLPQAQGTKQLRIDATGNISYADTLVDAGGTVTSVATNTGTGITGGTITTSGTIAADTLLLSTRKWRQKGIDSLQANINLKVNIADTSSMLSPYLRSNVASATYLPLTGGTITNTTADIGLRILSTGTYGLYVQTGKTYIQDGIDIQGSTTLINVATSSMLKTNSSGVITAAVAGTDYQAPITNPITGTGTSGRVAYWNGTSSQTSSSNLLFNGSELNVSGIKIAGNSLPYIISTLAGEDLNIQMPVGQALAINDNSAGAIASFSKTAHKFYINYSQAMTLDASGNLGLGVTPSTWQFGKAFELNYVGNGLWNNGVNDLVLVSNAYYNAGWKYGSNGYATKYSIYNGQYEWHTAGSGTAGNAISFTQAMTLTANGRLLINTPTEGLYTLDVNGTGRFTSSVAATSAILNSSGEDGSAGAVLRISTTRTNANARNWGIINTWDNFGDLTFRVSNAQGGNALSAGTSVMALFRSGNVGINTTSDAGYKLDVNGTGRFSGILEINAGSGGTDWLRLIRTGVVEWAFNANGGALNFVNNTGSINALSLASTGAATFSSSVTLNARASNLALRMQYPDDPNYRLDINQIVTSGLVKHSFDVVNAGTSYANNLVLDRGNVGIGTSSPQSKLEVLSSSAGALPPTSGTTPTSFVDIGSSAESQRLYIGSNTNSPYGFYLQVSNSTALGTNYPLLLNPNGGNVGIGETPSSSIGWSRILSLNGNNIGDAAYILKKTGSAQEIALGTDGAAFYIDVAGNSTGTNNNIIFRTASGNSSYSVSERMRIFSDGNVGIGTGSTNNGAKLQVNGDGYFSGNILIGRTTGFTTFGDSNGIVEYGDGAIYCSASNSESLGLARIGTDGNVAIFRRSTTTVGSISVTGSATSFNTSSDYRLKQDLKTFNGLALVDSIKVYDYQWKSDSTRAYGVMAHELQQVLPYAVTGTKDGKEMQGVDYSKIVPVLVQAVKELKNEIEDLKQQLKNK